MFEGSKGKVQVFEDKQEADVEANAEDEDRLSNLRLHPLLSRIVNRHCGGTVYQDRYKEDENKPRFAPGVKYKADDGQESIAKHYATSQQVVDRNHER